MTAQGNIYVEQYLLADWYKVWEALTTPALLAAWWAPGDVQPVPGHRFTLDMGPWGQQACKVTEVNPPYAFCYRLGIGTLDTHLEWALGPYQGGSIMCLWHKGFNLDSPQGKAAFQDMAKSWKSVLMRAADMLGGVMPGEPGRWVETETWPWGMDTMREYHGEGWLCWENHACDVHDVEHAKFCMAREYNSSGAITQEEYMFKGRLLSKKKYEALRKDYPDMPAAMA